MCLQKGWKTRGSTPTPTASTSYFVWYVCVIIRYVNSVGCGTSEQVLKTFRRNTQASWRNISQQQHRILLYNLRCDAQQCKEFNLSLALRYNKRHWFRQCQWEIPLRWRRLAIRHTAPSTNKYSKKKKKIGIEKNVDRYWGSIMLAGRTTSRKRTAGLNADIKAHWIYERWEFNKLDAYLTKHNQHWIIFYYLLFMTRARHIEYGISTGMHEWGNSQHAARSIVLHHQIPCKLVLLMKALQECGIFFSFIGDWFVGVISHL